MKQLFLVRHGNVDNPKNVVYGRETGFHLSEKGRLEIYNLARYFQTVPFDVVISSPLERAKESADIIAANKTDTTLEDDRLNEWGDFETTDEVAARMLAFFRDWAQSEYQASIAISHRDPMRCLLFALSAGSVTSENLLSNDFPVATGGVYVISLKDDTLSIDRLFGQKTE